ncbi:hypothetical protein R1sor_022737 [Riccia sorocarpa]|uniref:G-patch domain-containing protein n=1 Tax=Riccia sorocarpa TaxID=122646 RepID=A0ABD3GPL1_9MARC
MAEDPGFVLDEASGLYVHAGSGFYHDPNAGWYYNTHDGVYYTFEDGKYVPVPAADDSLVGIPKLGEVLVNSNCEEEVPQTLRTTERCSVTEDLSANGSFSTEPEEKGTDNGTDIDEYGVQLDHENSGGEDEYPLWYYDAVRSMYWYYDKGSRAYYLYQEEVDVAVNETSASEIPSEPTSMQGEHTTREGGAGLDYEGSCPSNEDVETFQPASGWVEEALIELYLKGYPQESAVDEGPWITSADIFSDTSGATAVHREDDGGSTLGCDNQVWSASNPENAAPELQVQSNDSDNDGSEELEEGEWVPDEPLRIVDGEEGEVCSFYTSNEVAEEETHGSELHVTDDGYYRYSEEFNDFSQENGEATGYPSADDPNDLGMEEGEINMEDEQKEEEQWQAQYGQVVREKTREYVIPGAVDLWDWAILDKEPKTPRQGKLKKQLVGRIVSSVSKLHPSLSGSSGLIRTSAIIAAELDFVKVSSGKIYRLRRPSKKHLATVDNYDSSNPTRNLGFPAIGLAAPDTRQEEATDDVGAASDQSKGRTDTLVSKPFVPNTGHWRFRSLLSAKKGRHVPAALMASRYLSPEEISINEQRKQRYRDRAAERRTLHGGFGVGPGQKGVSVVEQEKMEADEDAGMVGALEKAATAPPLGRENIGKRMLEGMGWKEGQTLGVEGGLIKPLQAQGNVGRTGLGWG